MTEIEYTKILNKKLVEHSHTVVNMPEDGEGRTVYIQRANRQLEEIQEFKKLYPEYSI